MKKIKQKKRDEKKEKRKPKMKKICEAAKEDEIQHNSKEGG